MSSTFHCNCQSSAVDVSVEVKFMRKLRYTSHVVRTLHGGTTIRKDLKCKVTGILPVGDHIKLLVEEKGRAPLSETTIALLELDEELNEVSRTVVLEPHEVPNRVDSAMFEDYIYVIDYCIGYAGFKDSPNDWEFLSDLRLRRITHDLKNIDEFEVEEFPEESFGGVVCLIYKLESNNGKLIMTGEYIPSEDLTEFQSEEDIDTDAHKYGITLIADFEEKTIKEK